MELSKGRIIFSSVNRYRLLSEEGSEYLCVLSGSFVSRNDDMPAVGDYVLFYANSDGDSVIHQLLPRTSEISRKTSGTQFSRNILAANVDIMLIAAALDRSFSRRRIERFLVLARSGGVKPVIILSKSDICDPVNRAVYLAEAEEAAGGEEVIEISSYTGEGIGKVADMLKDGITACAVGLSGAGKSTLLNRLSGEDVSLTAEVRSSDSRGRHTTTARHMYRLHSGAMFIDTPGLREIGMTDDAEAVEDVFAEISAAAEECFFADCSHVHEPGCAVLKGIKEGTVSIDRYDSYMKLKTESENYRMRTEEPGRKKQKDKKLSKLVKAESKRKKRF